MFQKIKTYFLENENLSGKEKTLRLIAIAILIIVPLLLLWLPGYYESTTYPPGAKVFTLTGLGSQGRWTLDNVNALNSWWKTFAKAEIHVEDGDLVILKLQSADVTHGFYAPTLGIGPVYVEPGHVITVTFRATKGIHPYYCTAICGDCHYFMRGEIIAGDVPPDPSIEFGEACPHNLPIPSGKNPVETGKYLFLTNGCVSCHGEGGRGGQFDPNYVKKFVPDLNKLAGRIAIDSKEDADSLTKYIELGMSVNDLELSMLNIPRKSVVLAKYKSIRDVIKEGRQVVARADTTSYAPPLFMPAWGDKLSEKDIDDILVYLFSVQVYEEGEE